jgi:hypothetical protein
VGDKFDTVRETMHRSSIMSLMKDTLSDNDPIHWLADLPTKSAGHTNFRVSKVTNTHIIQVMRGQETFSLQDNRATTSKVKAYIKKQKEAVRKTSLAGILNPIPRSLSRTIMRGSEPGAWSLAYGLTFYSFRHRAVIRRIL